MLVRFLVVDDPAQSARVRALPAPVKKFANATHLGGRCFTRRDSDKAVDKGRLLLAVEKYKNHEASLGKSAELAGFSFGQLMRKLGEYGVKANLDKEDCLTGLEHLPKVR